MRSLLQFLSIILFLGMSQGNAQEPGTTVKAKKEKGSFYFAWGYNKDWFSKSDIHFESKGKDNYSFTILNVMAKDKPKRVLHLIDQLFSCRWFASTNRIKGTYNRNA